MENQELTLTFTDAGLFIQYNDLSLPLDIKSYRLVLSYYFRDLEKETASNCSGDRELHRIKEFLDNLPSISDLTPQKAIYQYQERQQLKKLFLNIVKTLSQIKSILLQTITVFNKRIGETREDNLLHNLLEQQAYQLDYWQAARERLNYRRFFDINDLIATINEYIK